MRTRPIARAVVAILCAGLVWGACACATGDPTEPRVPTSAETEEPVPTIPELFTWAGIAQPAHATDITVTVVDDPDDLYEYAYRLTFTLPLEDVAEFTTGVFAATPEQVPLVGASLSGPATALLDPSTAQALGLPSQQPEGTRYWAARRSMDTPPAWKGYRTIVLVGPDLTTVHLGLHAWWR